MANIEMHFDTAMFERHIIQFLEQNQQEGDRAVFETAADVLEDIQVGWPVDQGVSRAAWRGPVRVGPMEFILTNPLPYAPVIEFGGYPGVGPKTGEFPGETLPGGIQINEGIYPLQRPVAPTRRALSKHRNAMLERIIRAHQRQWGRQ